MSDTDDILQGFLIGTFVIFGMAFIGCCVRRVKPKMVMLKSPSTEDLNSVDTTDPQQNEV